MSKFPPPLSLFIEIRDKMFSFSSSLREKKKSIDGIQTIFMPRFFPDLKMQII